MIPAPSSLGPRLALGFAIGLLLLAPNLGRAATVVIKVDDKGRLLERIDDDLHEKDHVFVEVTGNATAYLQVSGCGAGDQFKLARAAAGARFDLGSCRAGKGVTVTLYNASDEALGNFHIQTDKLYRVFLGVGAALSLGKPVRPLGDRRSLDDEPVRNTPLSPLGVIGVYPWGRSADLRLKEAHHPLCLALGMPLSKYFASSVSFFIGYSPALGVNLLFGKELAHRNTVDPPAGMPGDSRDNEDWRRGGTWSIALTIDNNIAHWF